jgi:hypothetical protein
MLSTLLTLKYLLSGKSLLRQVVLIVCSITIIGECVILSQHQEVFPELTGEELLITLQEEFRPLNTLTYAEARDVLYSRILNQNDSLECVYTSFTIYLDPEKNPRADAFEKGLNAEHIFPRSKGANQVDTEANMYNLFACRIDVNNDRGNLPFAELSDGQTNFWYYLDQKTTVAPIVNKEKYSRLGSGLFTPPQHHKGDIARAVMYFYTMYREFADAADPTFFQSQIEDLCKWHVDDPVDHTEWTRNQEIAMYQDDRSNPFILDCTLAERSYCNEYEWRCQPILNTENPINIYSYDISVYPNPTDHFSKIRISSSIGGTTILELYNILGRKIGRQKIDIQQNIPEHIDLQTLHSGQLVPGTYLLLARHFSGEQQFSELITLVKTN